MGVMLCFYRTRIMVELIRQMLRHFDERNKTPINVDLPEVPANVNGVDCMKITEKQDYG